MIAVELWRPYKWCIVGEMAVVALLYGVFFNDLAQRTLRDFPPPLGQIFMFGVAVASALVLYGSFNSDVLRGQLIERAGHYGLAFLLITYSATAASLFGLAGLQFAAMLFSRSVASSLTILQFYLLRRRGRKAVRRGDV